MTTREPRPGSAEQPVRDTRRATRKQYSAEEKIRIVLEGLRGETSIAELCRKEGIAQSMYYGWSKEFLEAGKRRLAGDTAREATSDEGPVHAPRRTGCAESHGRASQGAAEGSEVVSRRRGATRTVAPRVPSLDGLQFAALATPIVAIGPFISRLSLPETISVEFHGDPRHSTCGERQKSNFDND